MKLAFLVASLGLLGVGVGCGSSDSPSGSGGTSGAANSNGGTSAGTGSEAGGAGSSSGGTSSGGKSSGGKSSGGNTSSAGTSTGGSSSTESAECKTYCDCHDKNCAATPIPDGKSCADFCATFTADQMKCRAAMCSLVPVEPNNDHCTHSVGIGQCL